eukprot:1072239-Rhodomonas_salina.1
MACMATSYISSAEKATPGGITGLSFGRLDDADESGALKCRSSLDTVSFNSFQGTDDGSFW